MYVRHALLGVGNHFREEVGEAGATELGGAGAVEVPVVDGFAVGGGAEARLRSSLLRGLGRGGAGEGSRRLDAWFGGHCCRMEWVILNGS